MPELPEVQTTVNGLTKRIVGLTIADVWSDYGGKYWRGSKTIKDAAYFNTFKKALVGKRVISAERRAKNILINISGGHTILVHMKMTGHLLYGRYKKLPFSAKATKDRNIKNQKLKISNKDKVNFQTKKYMRTLTSGGKYMEEWEPIEPESLKDPYNRHVHFVLTFNNGRHLVLSDVRKFAKVALEKTNLIHQSSHLREIGPEPLDESFDFAAFNARLNLRPKARIKPTLMDQKIVAGIGNIYADESLWRAGIHPIEMVKNVSAQKRRALHGAIKKTLSKGLDLGGDSMSDYRNIDGERGAFQEHHYAYQRTGERCKKSGCTGTIRRVVIGTRSAHYCDHHQKL